MKFWTWVRSFGLAGRVLIEVLCIGLALYSGWWLMVQWNEFALTKSVVHQLIEQSQKQQAVQKSAPPPEAAK